MKNIVLNVVIFLWVISVLGLLKISISYYKQNSNCSDYAKDYSIEYMFIRGDCFVLYKGLWINKKEHEDMVKLKTSQGREVLI